MKFPPITTSTTMSNQRLHTIGSPASHNAIAEDIASVASPIVDEGSPSDNLDHAQARSLPSVCPAEGPCPFEVARNMLASDRVIASILPADEIFQPRTGVFDAGLIPELFIGAVLADRYVITRYVGDGSIGRGWVGQDTTASVPTPVFIKTMRCAADKAARKARLILRELRTLLSLEQQLPTHANVVSATLVAYGSVTVPATGRSGEMFFTVTTDVCTRGDLYSHAVRQSAAAGGPVTAAFRAAVARRIFADVARGLAHMHANGVFHQDIKLENIVCDAAGRCKLTDFGHARLATECLAVPTGGAGVTYYASGIVGSEATMPPEVAAERAAYDAAAVDAWQLGVLLTLLVGIEAVEAAGSGMCVVRDAFHLLECVPGGIPAHRRFWCMFDLRCAGFPADAQLRALIGALLNKHAASQPSIAEVLTHPWLQGPMAEDESVCERLGGLALV